MSITYANKDNTATPGSPERQWRAADANEVKSEFNTLETAVGLNTAKRSYPSEDETKVASVPDDLPTALNLSGITIVETSTGVWSGSLPARAAGVRAAEFRSVTDPADATNGVTGKENIQAGDKWIELDSL